MNENQPIVMLSEIVEISEHKTYLELVSRVCYYDDYNLNKVMLPYDETTLEKAQTLVNMPVQGRYRTNAWGLPTFSGHCMTKDKDGNVSFGTQSIGTHTEVYIEDDTVVVDGEEKTLPCLFAKYRIWKRYKNAVAAVRRLFNLGKLFSSWEINVYDEVVDEDGSKTVVDYEFLSNCLLGYEYSYPSYGENATAISIAEQNSDNCMLLVAEALSKDLIETENIENSEVKEDENVKDENKQSEKTAEPVVAQLTERDLRRALIDAIEKKLDEWVDAFLLFPADNEVWVHTWSAEKELDFVKFTYTVEGDDVALSEPEDVVLTVSPREINTEVASLNTKIGEVQAQLDIKNEAVISASKTINDLNVKISDLTPYKAQVEKAEAERIEAEIAQVKEQLKQDMLKGGLFTAEEIEQPEIAELIEVRNKSAIKGLIADKYLASLDVQSTEVDKSEVAESQDNEVETASANLNIDEVDDDFDPRSIMRGILYGNRNIR